MIVDVVVYVQPGCMPCRAVKRKLTALGVAYRSVDVTVDAVAAEHVRELGATESPVVEFGESWHTGYRPSRLTDIAATLAEGDAT